MESETTCPVKSTSMQELMAVTFGFIAMMLVEFTNEMSHITEKNQRSMIRRLIEIQIDSFTGPLYKILRSLGGDCYLIN